MQLGKMWFDCLSMYRDRGLSAIIWWLFSLNLIFQLMQITFQLVREALKMFLQSLVQL